MNLTLAELLPLVGRLDSAPGFDSPRERYRRFLLEHVTDVTTARTLVEECQRSVGEQRHRALQDLVVLLGRFLGFETIFGSYERAAGVDGQWRSRGLLDVVLEIRTEQTSMLTADSLVRAVAVPGPTRTDPCPRIGLAVVARHFTARSRLEQAMAADTHSPELRIVSVRSLLALATQVAADRLSHLEVVRLLQSGFALDFVIDLLDRPAPALDPVESFEEAAAPPPEADVHDPSFWVATVIGNEMSPPEQLLGSVIAHRRVLGICHSGPLQGEGEPGDWVCFFLPGKGIVGHAQLASVVEEKASVVRNGEQFSRVYRLARVEMYEEPIVQALRSGRPFAVPSPDVALAGPCLAPIARQDFVALTTYRDEVEARRASA